MQLDSRGYVSIVELIVFVPCLILAFVVCLRHGFKRTSGWIFILILSAIRTAGAICQLLTYNNPTEGLIKATLIIDSVGIAPLLLAVLGVLSRLVDWINAAMQSPKFDPKIFRILQMLTGVGLILGIIGVTVGESQAADGTFTPSTISKAGIVLYIVGWVAIAIIYILSLSDLSAVPRPERILRVHIPIALLAIAIRLLYAALCIFVHNSTFSLFSGSIVADILMAIVEEFFVVVATLVLGFKLRKISPSMEAEIMDHNQKGRNNGEQSKNGSYGQPSNSGFETFSSA